MKILVSMLAVTLAISDLAVADETTHRVYANPIERKPPRYPDSELRRGQQGWVDLNYVVTKDGEVIDPVVEASSGSPAFEQVAKRTVTRWKYEPALVDGEPVQQCRTKVRIAFAIQGSQQAVSRRFHSNYRKIDRLIEDGDLVTAEQKIDKAFDAKGLSVGELTWLWALRARIAGMRGDDDAQLAAIHRTAAASSEWIPDSLKIGLLKTRFVLDIDRSNYSDALETFAALQTIEDADLDAFAAVADEIEALVASNSLLYRDAVIGADDGCESCDRQWQYKPLRRAVEIAEIDGELNDIELRCDWQRFVDQAREGVSWEIPDSWGDCSIVVHGTPGTTFKLFEIPSS